MPGQTATHVTLGTYGMFAWFSEWQVQLILASLESIMTDPMVEMVQSKLKRPPPAQQQQDIQLQRATEAAGKQVSKLSLLVDVPLLSLLCYASLPVSQSCKDSYSALITEAARWALWQWKQVLVTLEPGSHLLCCTIDHCSCSSSAWSSCILYL